MIPDSPLSLSESVIGLAVVTWVCLKAKERLELSFAKNPSLGGHVRWSKRFASQIPSYSYDETQWFGCDDAPQTVQDTRRQALSALGQDLVGQSPITLAHTEKAKPMISDLQFTSNYRVPFQFKSVILKHIQIGAFWRASGPVRPCDPRRLRARPWQD